MTFRDGLFRFGARIDEVGARDEFVRALLRGARRDAAADGGGRRGVLGDGRGGGGMALFPKAESEVMGTLFDRGGEDVLVVPVSGGLT